MFNTIGQCTKGALVGLDEFEFDESQLYSQNSKSEKREAVKTLVFCWIIEKRW
jgi:hypothetical protein